MTVVVSYLIFFVILLCITGVPGYVIAERRGLSKPWVAFVPIVGFWIVLCESVDRSGWLTLWILVPYLGALGLAVWTAFTVPVHHGRSRWWTLAFIVPLVNLVAYWCYAFSLPEPSSTPQYASA